MIAIVSLVISGIVVMILVLMERRKVLGASLGEGGGSSRIAGIGGSSSSASIVNPVLSCKYVSISGIKGTSFKLMRGSFL